MPNRRMSLFYNHNHSRWEFYSSPTHQPCHGPEEGPHIVVPYGADMATTKDILIKAAHDHLDKMVQQIRKTQEQLENLSFPEDLYA